MVKVITFAFSIFARLDPLPEVEVIQESVFDSIKPVRHEEPTDLATSTRIGFRLSDGSRLMHRFPKSAPVRALFEYIKSEVEDARTQQFEASRVLYSFCPQLLFDVQLFANYTRMVFTAVK